MFLGVDLGKKTTGLAISSGTISSPLKTITHKSLREVVEKISAVCQEEGIETIVLGYVEGKIKNYFLGFEKKFKEKNPGIEIVLVDETLTSRQATETMININLPKVKRQKKEHEIAASLILQGYLNELETQ
ncbi:MAG: Holliday junction resolvase RuvX [Patescibacteria group bacterium]